MVQSGQYTKEFLGTVYSAYFLVYAVGQLLNGLIGDRVKAKYMVSLGLIVCGFVSILFPSASSAILQIVLFGIMGFSLSMLRDPIVKTISENMPPQNARLACVFISFVSYLGPFAASLLVLVFKWNMAFVAAGIICIAIGIIAFAFLSILEKKGAIKTNNTKISDKPKNVLGIFKLKHFVFGICGNTFGGPVSCPFCIQAL